VSNIIKFDTSFTISEFKETVGRLRNSVVGIVDKYPFGFSQIVTIIYILDNIPVVTVIAFIGTGCKVYIAWAVPDGESSITYVVSIILETKRLIGDSENIVPGIGFPIDPFVPSVDSVL
jgi:hypothetical protein